MSQSMIQTRTDRYDSLVSSTSELLRTNSNRHKLGELGVDLLQNLEASFLPNVSDEGVIKVPSAYGASNDIPIVPVSPQERLDGLYFDQSVWAVTPRRQYSMLAAIMAHGHYAVDEAVSIRDEAVRHNLMEIRTHTKDWKPAMRPADGAFTLALHGLVEFDCIEQGTCDPSLAVACSMRPIVLVDADGINERATFSDETAVILAHEAIHVSDIELLTNADALEGRAYCAAQTELRAYYASSILLDDMLGTEGSLIKQTSDVVESLRQELAAADAPYRPTEQLLARMAAYGVVY